MAVQQPTAEQVRAAAEEVGLALTDDDVKSYQGLIAGNIAAYNMIDHMPDELPIVQYPRTPGYFPAPEENKHIKTNVSGTLIS